MTTYHTAWKMDNEKKFWFVATYRPADVRKICIKFYIYGIKLGYSDNRE